MIQLILSDAVREELVSSNRKQLQKNPVRLFGPGFDLVETAGLEPATSCMSSKRSNQLSYAS